ncbi:MAG: DUF1080 domain-containing protein [Pseudomonadota bacterium]
MRFRQCRQAFSVVVLMVAGCASWHSTSDNSERWQPLLDSNLTHWDNYLSYRFEPGYDGSEPDVAPIGLNQPAGDRVFSTQIVDGDTVLRISGEIYGALITKQRYRNYHLRLQVKWGEQKWDPRKDLLRDSGILYHSVGPHGAEWWRSWMQAQEFQVMEGHMGDYWSQATSAMDVRAYTPEYIMNPVASLTQPFLKVGHGEDIAGLVIRSDNHESKDGWTVLELICFEGQSLHIVNGHVVMVLKNSRYEKDGVVVPLDEGRIQLQSEGAEVFYKNVEIRQIESLPRGYQTLMID